MTAIGESWRMHATARLALARSPLVTDVLASGCADAAKQDDAGAARADVKACNAPCQAVPQRGAVPMPSTEGSHAQIKGPVARGATPTACFAA